MKKIKKGDTTIENVMAYEATHRVFHGLFREVKDLSKKKPDATLSEGKVALINKLLLDMKTYLDDEPEGRYLEILNDEELPQHSDAVLVMVQFEAATEAFHARYYRYEHGIRRWVISDED